ncbi:DUF1990 family protein [Brachybacterium hainanense]|uniref:DUF1990 family protein n=1 Tax=Brachybacterium hainanense TaxID=1541174 RepID=A0ABV6RDD0_9MICO
MQPREPLTYPEVGGTLRADLVDRPPPGCRAVERRVRIGEGEAAWRAAAEEALRWGIQRRSGIRVAPARPGALELGDDVVMRVPLWPRDVPCRVVLTVDEEPGPGGTAVRGFAYGTLPGHPERGEEVFLLEHEPDGSVWLRIRAFSRPASWIFRLGYPAVLLMQRIYTDRYLRSLTGVARAAAS